MLDSSKEIDDRGTTDNKDRDLVLDNELYFIKKLRKQKRYWGELEFRDIKNFILNSEGVSVHLVKTIFEPLLSCQKNVHSRNHCRFFDALGTYI